MGFFEERAKEIQAKTPASFKQETEKQQVTKITKYLGSGTVAKAEIKRVKKNRSRSSSRAKAIAEAERLAKIEAELEAKRKAEELKKKLEAERKAKEKAEKLKQERIEKKQLSISKKKAEIKIKQELIKQKSLFDLKKKGTQQLLKVIRVPKEESKILQTRQAISKFMTPDKDDIRITRILKGAGAFVFEPVSQLFDFVPTVFKASVGDKLSQTQIKLGAEQIDLKQIGPALGSAVQSSDPYISTQGLMSVLSIATPVAVPKLTTINTVLNKFKSKSSGDIIKIDNKIKDLETKGVTVRDRNKLGDKLRSLKEERLISKSTLTEIDKSIKTMNKPNQTNVQKKKIAKELGQETKKIKENIIKIDNIKKKTKSKQQPKLKTKVTKDVIKKVEQIKNKDVIKIVDEKFLIDKLLEARKISGTAFKKLKLDIQRELNVKVVQRMKKGKVSFKLLQPKKIKLKTKKKVEKEIVVVGKTVRVQKVKKEKVKQVEAPKEKLSLKELDRLDKLLALELKRGRTRKKKTLMNKKGQAQLFKTGKAYYNKSNRHQNIMVDKNRNTYVNLVRKYYKDPKDLRKGIKTEFKNLPKSEKVKVEKQLNKIKQDLKDIQKDLMRFKEISKLLLKAGVITITNNKKAFANVQDTINKTKIIEEQINKTKEIFEPTPEPKPKPDGKGKGGDIGKPKPITQDERKRKIKPIVIPIIKKFPKHKKKPNKIKLIPKIPKIDWKSNPTKNKLGAITYKIKNKTKTIRTNLPYNKALTLARDTIDNTILASMSVKAYGKTKKKDTRQPSLNKFRVKKGKNVLVQELVEKRKHRLDTRGEKSELKVNKFIKNKIQRLL